MLVLLHTDVRLLRQLRILFMCSLLKHQGFSVWVMQIWRGDGDQNFSSFFQGLSVAVPQWHTWCMKTSLKPNLAVILTMPI